MIAIALALNVAAAALSAGGPPVKRQSYDDLFRSPLQTPMHGKLALITGASSGIGRATACALANKGCNLILVARRSERLIELQDECKRRLPDVSVTCVAGDVCDDGLYDELRSLGCLENIDFFVNNAGGAFGKDRVVDADISDWKGMLDVNAMAAFRMVHAVLPAMVSRGEGHIISIGSIAGLEAYEGGAVYCAVKHALHAFHQAIRYETYESGVRCTIVAPGNVGEGTEFAEVRFKGDATKASAVYTGMQELKATDIASQIVWACQQPVHVNLDTIHIMPTAQGGATRIYRSLDDS